MVEWCIKYKNSFTVRLYNWKSDNLVSDSQIPLKFAIDNAEDNLKKWTQFQKEKRLTGWTPEKNKKKDKEEKGSDNK